MSNRIASVVARPGAVSPLPERRSSGGGEVVPLYAVGSPIRGRSGIIELAQRVIAECATQARKDPPLLSEDAVRYLCDRPWTHEELAIRLRRAVAANTGSLIVGADLGEA
jgi:hypothetical protein